MVVAPGAVIAVPFAYAFGRYRCRIKPGLTVTRLAGERFIADSSSEIANYQRLMYANGIHGDAHRVLIVLQGMDASGKGGIVRHVFSQVDPMGIHYHGFGKPSEEDLAHDYLWRIRRELPANGWISIFDRSQYEDIVMPRITGSLPEATWRARYGQINDFEAELAGSGCAIIKIFLVSSRQAQKQHFLRRLDDPTRYWKFDPSDLDARDRWDDYMAALRGGVRTDEHLDCTVVSDPRGQEMVLPHGRFGVAAHDHEEFQSDMAATRRRS